MIIPKLLLGVLDSMMRLLGYTYNLICIQIAVGCINMGVVGYLLCFVFDLGTLGLVLSILINCCLMILIFTGYWFSTDLKNVKISLNEYDDIINMDEDEDEND